MSARSQNTWLTAGLLFAVFLWGANNSGTKAIVSAWPPVWTGASRFTCAGLLLLFILKRTSWFGTLHSLDRHLNRQLWWRGGLSLAIYIVVFNTALYFTSASHVALYLGASPVWALLWERQALSWAVARKYAAALLALSGVVILFLPALHHAPAKTVWIGEVLGLLTGVLWTHYGRQCRLLSAQLSGAEVSAHTMWRAGILLLPLALVEIANRSIPFERNVVLIQLYCIVGGGVVAFAIWANALRHWPASRVLLFNNLIPLSTMGWSHFCLGEPVTRTFWLAMVLVFLGVVLGQAQWGMPRKVDG
jgi:drug/metabolite transporter (DMT)-like permease